VVLLHHFVRARSSTTARPGARRRRRRRRRRRLRRLAVATTTSRRMAAAAPGAGAAKQLTLLLLHTGGRVLLGRKKRGFGAGKLNGFGGKIEPGETILGAALRETLEEACVAPRDAALVGHLLFSFVGHAEVLEVHVFRATAYDGTPAETDEMAPCWHDAHALPLGAMWLDDAHWLPLLLQGQRFRGAFVFEGHERIVEHTLHVLAPGEALPHDALSVLVTGARQGPILA
jgi:8-oxo-dGTP pyrophosphatase MutT (NUDIX family)